ncbi:MAG: hypothetical protein HYT15_00030 [Candidatus Magasanikbacteria bacterium]|nr:hypothetical protein [Candidatus Magasanikbacteria bacterium]
MADKKIFLKSLSKTIYCLSFFVSFFIVTNASAATLYLSPNSGAKQVGKTFTISVYVSSADQAMNAASGEIDVPTDKLEVVSISKSGSIFSLWAQEPSFSAGSVRFEGVVLNPGFKGSSGKLVTFTLRAKAAGEADVRFSSGSVLANDGNGTNILTGMGSAKFTLGSSGQTPPEEIPQPVETAGVPAAPKVTSSNCPDSEGACVGNNPAFSWVLPAGITGVSILADRNYNSNPGTRSDGIMRAHTYTDVDDGVWYFHIRLRNSYGWGAVTHYKFQIDTKKPDHFDLSLYEPVNPLNPRAKLSVDAKDSGSGIKKYEIKIDSAEAQTWIDDGRHIFQTEPLAPGKHAIVAKAIDAAGNYVTASLEILVNPIEAPKILEYPEEISTGETLIIKGQSYPDVKITLYIQKEGGETTQQSVRTDSSGKFKIAVAGKLSDGVYSVWAEAENDSGAKSNPSEKLGVVVSERPILKIGSLIVSYLSVVVSLLAITALLSALAWYGWYKLRKLTGRVQQEVKVVEKNIHQAFDMLRENTRKQITTLEKVKLKRELTIEEAKILSQLKNNLNAAEKFINKGIEKIERELK